MKIQPFKLERYFAKYEFSAPYLLSCSDCEPLSLKELLSMADDEALQMWENLTLGYTESQGHPLLREEIVKLYDTIQPEDVLVITPEEGIFIAMNNLLSQGDHVITTFPSYQSLYEIANTLGCEVSKWLPRGGDNLSFDINDLETLVKDNTRVIVINFPHNPTGATITKDELQKIIQLAKKNDIKIFSDEMYRYLEHDPINRLPSVADLYENGISLFGVSKTFALAGLRIGWLTTKNKEVFRQLADYKDYTTICSSAPSEILSIIALKAKSRIIKRNFEIINKNLILLDKFFEEFNEFFSWEKPIAGPIGFPRLKSNTSINDLALDLVNKKGVMILPAKVYDYEGNNFRLGFARKNMPEALDRLVSYLKENY